MLSAVGEVLYLEENPSPPHPQKDFKMRWPRGWIPNVHLAVWPSLNDLAS